MPSRPYARVAALTAACLGLAVPVALAAPGAGRHPDSSDGPTSASGTGGNGASGGAGLDPTSTTSGAATTTGVAQTTPVDGPVSAEGNGYTLTTSAAGTYRRQLAFSGTAPAGDGGDGLAIQFQTADGTWQDAADTTVASGGAFTVTWRASESGVVTFRAAIEPPAGTLATASATDAASPPLSVTIYRDAVATIYGPGFYGHKTACGETLRRDTLGVASRTLKCGTEVAFDFHGQSVTVPVIDRGPYGGDANWDLTEATAESLGDTETETVGAAVI